MSDSSIVTKFMQAYSGNYTKGRAANGGKIKKITVHHCAGNMSIDQLGKLWQTSGRRGSSHYGVQGSQIGQYVNESDIAWTDNNWSSNISSVTIETANNSGAPNWTVSDETLRVLISLVADIAKRNNLGTLVPGQNLTWHQMYYATACPGPYLLGKMQYIADQANVINASSGAPSPDSSDQSGTTATLYYVQVGAFSSVANAQDYALKIKKAGYAATIKQISKLHHVQVGAFASEKNAKSYMETIKKAGFDAVLVKG